MKHKLKNQKGASITLFVVFTCILALAIGVISYAKIGNDKQAQSRQINQVTKTYNQNETEMEQMYQNAIQ